MPGSNPRALEKAKGLPADGLIFDLEDAVAPAAKAEARERVADAIRAGGMTLIDVKTEEADLEDVFLQLTSKAKEPVSAA